VFPLLQLSGVFAPYMLALSSRAWLVAARGGAVQVSPRHPLRVWPRHSLVPLFSVLGESDGAPVEYTNLVEAALPAVNMEALEQELSGDVWSQESLFVKALLQEGAQEVKVSPPSADAGHEREMSFLMRTGIPWNKVRAFLRMQGKEQEVDAAVGGGNAGLSSVKATHQILESSANSIKVKSTYVVTMPRLDLHLLVSLQNGKYTFDGAVEFFSWPSASLDLFQYGIVRKFMEASFMKALEHYGKTILAELRRRAE